MIKCIYKEWSNMRNTSERTCSCGSWKDHWKNYSGHRWPATCSVEGCFAEPVLGAHVKRDNDASGYIVPMCDSCNKKSEHFALKSSVIPVREDACKDSASSIMLNLLNKIRSDIRK